MADMSGSQEYVPRHARVTDDELAWHVITSPELIVQQEAQSTRKPYPTELLGDKLRSIGKRVLDAVRH